MWILRVVGCERICSSDAPNLSEMECGIMEQTFGGPTQFCTRSKHTHTVSHFLEPTTTTTTTTSTTASPIGADSSNSIEQQGATGRRRKPNAPSILEDMSIDSAYARLLDLSCVGRERGESMRPPTIDNAYVAKYNRWVGTVITAIMVLEPILLIFDSMESTWRPIEYMTDVLLKWTDSD